MKSINLIIIMLILVLSGCSGSDTSQIQYQSVGWTTPQKIGVNSYSYLKPAINSNGDVIVQYNSENIAYLNVYNQNNELVEEHVISSNVANFEPGSISINDAGQGVFVYCETIDNVRSIKSIQYSPEAGWGGPQVISASVPNSWSTKASIASNGDILVAWYQVDYAIGNSIYSSFYKHDAGWRNPVRLSNLVGGDIFLAGLAVNEAGNFLVLWSERDNTTFTSTCYKSVFNSATGWNTPELLLSGVGDRVISMSDMDRNGNVALTMYWTDSVSLVQTLFGRIGVNSPLELSPQALSDSTSVVLNPQMNSYGDAFVAWVAGESPNTSIQGLNYSHINGWGHDSEILKNAFLSTIHGNFSGMDDFGNIYLSCMLYINDAPNLAVIRYSPGIGWGPSLITNNASIYTYIRDSSLVVAKHGKAAFIWTIYEPTSEVPPITMTRNTYISFYH